jgi:hypothetical protein
MHQSGRGWQLLPLLWMTPLAAQRQLCRWSVACVTWLLPK